MFKEKTLITPQRCGDVANGNDSANEVATRARKLVQRTLICKDLPHNGAGGDRHKLIGEVSLPFISPAVNVVRLKLEEEGRLRSDLSLATLCVFAPVLYAHRAYVVCHLGQLFSNRFTGAFIQRLVEMSGPPVLEEVERRLAIKRKHRHRVR